MFFTISFTFRLSLLLIFINFVSSADSNSWRKRSIYQVIVDRYALPDGADTNNCNVTDQTWCGGTWNTLRDNLDYIQNMGFTAVWISPVSQNYDGPRTPYGDPYHGYWIQDFSQLNPKFGTSDDLKALSDELHRRGMYLMVDAVVNDVMALSITPDYANSQYFFKDSQYYHPYCAIGGDNTSQVICWLGDTVVPLADVTTEDPYVVQAYGEWIKELVQNYSIDGLRIDAAKNVNLNFWRPFCDAAGVYCIGEVFTGDISDAAQYQGPEALDAILQYPMYGALTTAFAIPGAQNMSALVDTMAQCEQAFTDTTLLGNFLEDQDVPRWGNLSVDPQSLYNAMVFGFLSNGIPVVYYGQEQYFHGNSDPQNREPLWSSNYTQTPAVELITTLNTLRNYLVNTSDWATQPTTVLNLNNIAMAFQKGDIISVVTNIGSPPQNSSIGIFTNWNEFEPVIDIISCTNEVVGSNGTLLKSYSTGGTPTIYVRTNDINVASIGICNQSLSTNANASQSSGQRSNLSIFSSHASIPVITFAFLLGLFIM